jgi:hypothetical protein
MIKPGYIFGEYLPIMVGKTDVGKSKIGETYIKPSTWLPTPPHPREAYYDKRKRCPCCYGTWLSQTLVGYTFDMSKPEEFEDRNEARCQACGWVGLVHDMTPL